MSNDIYPLRAPTGNKRKLLSNGSGIYRITNTKNGKIYIGSASNLRFRRNRHSSQLRAKAHHSIYLQRSVDKYGIDIFVVDVLEYVEVDKLIEREQYYMDNLKPEYNIAKDVKQTTLGIKLSDTARLNMSKAHTGLRHSEETKQRIAASNTGKKFSEERKASCRAGWARRKALLS